MLMLSNKPQTRCGLITTALAVPVFACLLGSAAVLADSRLPMGPLPEPVVSTEDCLGDLNGWGWDGEQSCRVSNYRFEGELYPLTQTSRDWGGSALVWNRIDLANKTVRCDSYRRNFGSDESTYVRARYDITFLTEDQIPSSSASENLNDVSGHFYLRGWEIRQFGQLETGLSTNFDGTGIATDQGYIFIDESRRDQNSDRIISRFSHCYLRDEDTPFRATGYCVDYDGDGVGWNGSEACTVEAVDPNCDYSASDLGSNVGWGYNTVTGESCPPVPNTTTFVPEDRCALGADGWGWNHARQESCLE